MPKVPKISLKGKKKQVVTVIVVLVLLIAAVTAGVLLRWQQSKNSGSNGGGDRGITISNGESDGLNQNSLPQSVKDAQNSAALGNYDQSNKQIGASIATATSSDEKYELYLQQGINYENQSQFDNAIAAYKSAEAIKKTSAVYIALGRASEAKGDKAAALAYYKQAIPLMNQNDPMYNFDKSELDGKIKALGG